MKTKQSYYKNKKYEEILNQIQIAKLKNLAKMDFRLFANILSGLIKNSK